jgi:hypothetical protein
MTTAICLMVLYQVSRPFNWWKMLIFAAMVTCSLIAIFFLGDHTLFGKPFLRLVPLKRDELLLLLLLLESSYPAMLVISKLLQKMHIIR